jgi:very-short-patch-repair endonuclease
MSPPFLAMLVVAVLAVAAALLKTSTSRKKAPLKSLGELDNLTRRAPLTPHEQKMYTQLCSALPGCVVLAQVAFSALLTTRSKPTRNRFDRKVADFVICNKSMAVLAIVELDDASHKGREAIDADRDAMLTKAGYATLRYKSIPPDTQIQSDMGAIIRKAAA